MCEELETKMSNITQERRYIQLNFKSVVSGGGCGGSWILLYALQP